MQRGQRGASIGRMRGTSNNAAVVFLLLAIGCQPNSAGRSADPRIARIESEFGLLPPYSIDSVSHFLDGGSCRLVLEGANRRRLVLCWNGSMSDARIRRTRLLYVPDLNDPSDAVPVCSARESVLVDLLQLTAEFRLGRVVTARLDSIYRAGDRNGYMDMIRRADESGQHAMDAYMLASGVRAQQASGYWRLAGESDPEAAPP